MSNCSKLYNNKKGDKNSLVDDTITGNIILIEGKTDGNI